MNNKDFIGSVLSTAVALEVVTRQLVARCLDKQSIEPLILEILDQANFRGVLNRLNKMSFWKKLEPAVDFKKFNKLMDLRNNIMHAADIAGLDAKELRTLHTAVREFAYFVTDEFPGS
jgi:hypothetical protein